jgi:hypothetical protein
MYFHFNFHKTIKYVPSISMSTLMFYAFFSRSYGTLWDSWDGPRWSCLARPMPRWLWPERRRPLKTRVRKLRKVRKSWRAGNCSRSWTDVPFFRVFRFFEVTTVPIMLWSKASLEQKKHKKPDFTGVYRMPHVKLIPTTGTRTTPKKWKQ